MFSFQILKSFKFWCLRDKFYNPYYSPIILYALLKANFFVGACFGCFEEKYGNIIFLENDHSDNIFMREK